MANAVAPMEQFEGLLASSDVLFVVVFRGHWCPFCMSYLKRLQELTPAIEARKGTVVAITAEPEAELANTRKASGFQGTIIADQDNAIVTELAKRNIVNVAVDEKKGYKHGMAQPAVIALKGWNDVLFSWAIVPSLMNLGGAKDRPDLGQVWANTQAKMDGQAPKHKTLSTTGALGLLRQKIMG